MILGTVLAWDFYVLPPDGNNVFMSHDELFGVYTKTHGVKATLTATLGDEIVDESPK